MIKWRFSGIDFSVSLLFPAALVVMFTIDPSALPVWCAAASIMHEAGHFLAIYALGQKPRSVRAGIFGVCVTPNPQMPVGYTGNMIVSLSGPAVNLLSFAVICAAAGLSQAAIVHLTLAVFNLLPVEPLDGGQALYALMAQHTSEKSASRVLTALSVMTVAPMATAGFYLLISSGYNFTLLAVSLYLCLLLLLKERKPV